MGEDIVGEGVRIGVGQDIDADAQGGGAGPDEAAAGAAAEIGDDFTGQEAVVRLFGHGEKDFRVVVVAEGAVIPCQPAAPEVQFLPVFVQEGVDQGAEEVF